MTFPAQIYVDSAGRIYGAAKTDQRHTSAANRTVNGRTVIYAGSWYGSQMSYRPFRKSVDAARAEAQTREIGGVA